MTDINTQKIKDYLPRDWAKKASDQSGKSADWCRRVLRNEHEDDVVMGIIVAIALEAKRKKEKLSKKVESL